MLFEGRTETTDGRKHKKWSRYEREERPLYSTTSVENDMEMTQ